MSMNKEINGVTINKTCEANIKRVLCVGSLIMDMFPANQTGSIAEQPFFTPVPGGAVGNVAVMLTRMGVDATLVAKVGNDAFGRHMINTYKNNYVDTDCIILDNKRRTTMNFHAYKPNGRVEYLFYRNPGADTMLSQEELPLDLLDDVSLLHFDSLCFSDEPFKSTCLSLMKNARRKRIPVSLDVNYREPVWPDGGWPALMEELFAEVDILKLNEAELALLNPEAAKESILESIAQRNVGIVLVTEGEQGATILHNGAFYRHSGYKVETVDTIGCGDAFMGAFLSQFIDYDVTSAIPGDRLNIMLIRANAAAALTATKRGALSALPKKEEIMELAEKI